MREVIESVLNTFICTVLRTCVFTFSHFSGETPNITSTD